jgi:hypothetical protein
VTQPKIEHCATIKTRIGTIKAYYEFNQEKCEPTPEYVEVQNQRSETIYDIPRRRNE